MPLYISSLGTAFKCNSRQLTTLISGLQLCDCKPNAWSIRLTVHRLKSIQQPKSDFHSNEQLFHLYPHSQFFFVVCRRVKHNAETEKKNATWICSRDFSCSARDIIIQWSYGRLQKMVANSFISSFFVHLNICFSMGQFSFFFHSSHFTSSKISKLLLRLQLKYQLNANVF